MLLVAADNLIRVNEAYGFDVAAEVIAAVARRVNIDGAARRCLAVDAEGWVAGQVQAG